MEPYLLENWELFGQAVGYKPPESCLRLRGSVFGHPKHKDGNTVKTTRIVAIKENLIETLSGSVYKLGQPNVLYEIAFPNARERLLKMEFKDE